MGVWLSDYSERDAVISPETALRHLPAMQALIKETQAPVKRALTTILHKSLFRWGTIDAIGNKRKKLDVFPIQQGGVAHGSPFRRM